MKIRTAIDEYAAPEVESFDIAERPVAFLDLVAAQRDPAALTRPRPTGETNENVKAVAYVNQGRWVVDCPLGCGSALVVSPEDPRFFCVECRNAAIEHAYAKIVFPAKRTREKIEEILLERPYELHRSWLPSETVGQLRAENEEPIVKAGIPTARQEAEQRMVDGGK